MNKFKAFIDKVTVNEQGFSFEEFYKLSGARQLHWAFNHMPICAEVSKVFPSFEGKRIAICIHGEAKSAVMALYFKFLGADVAFAGSNPLSTKDDIMEALRFLGVHVFAHFNCTQQEYDDYLEKVCDFDPHFIIDDGGDLVSHMQLRDTSKMSIIGGSEETTTGVNRLKILVSKEELKFPMYAVNDAKAKYLFDNRYGTSQSALVGIAQSLNISIPGSIVVVAGYGWVGKGIAKAAKALGASVIVTEVDPIPACEALFDGHQVMRMDDAAKYGDIFVTCTGCCDVITSSHFMSMKDGAVVCNAGHFDSEVDVEALGKMAVDSWEVRDGVKLYSLNFSDQVTKTFMTKTIYVIADGRLVNLANAGLGHPADIMDMSFACQMAAILTMHHHTDKLAALKRSEYLIFLDDAISTQLCLIKLSSKRVLIDKLTAKQQIYLYGETNGD